ncbi:MULTISPECIES: hypothetical protein [Lysobacter]|uniref:Uncharacterized protein n=1 Tax=Lysobacter firmicutimachus TaxID=1792846 RepID=A0ABU8CY75_9GAMM|nr:hypothetical protein [Lysobacter antibioticus]
MRAKIAFFSGFLVAAAVAVAVNALPYWRTRQAYRYDGQEVAGFPFVFRRIGGDCAAGACENYGLHLGYFAADLALGLAFAVLAGVIATAIARRPRAA